MSNNNNHNSMTSCAVAVRMISYLYGETNSSERVELEAHLLNCRACADEFATFGVIRSSIQEWRNEEFTNLATPLFEIETDYSEKQIVPPSYQTWLAKLREVFTTPVLATAALAVFVLCAGLVLFTTNLHRTDESAVETGDKNSIETGVLPTDKNIAEPANDNSTNLAKSVPEKSLKLLDRKTENVQQRITRAKQIPANEFAVVISDNAAKRNSGDAEFNRNVRAANKTIKKSPTAEKPPTPLYSVQDDEEDKSVRLADLFDQIDSK